MAPTSSQIAFVTILALVGAAYWDLHGRLGSLDTRLAETENQLAVLAPLTTLIGAASGPGGGVAEPWQPPQATGPPDAGNGESARAWCPGAENAGPEWLELTFPEEVAAAEIRLHENVNPGAVHRITAESGEATPPGLGGELWSTTAAPWAGEAPRRIPLDPPARLRRIRLHLDTAAVPGWNEIDAVALVTPEGREVWATSAEASSSWKRGGSGGDSE